MSTFEKEPLNAAQFRRLQVFADMNEDQASLFLDLVEPMQVRANRLIVKRDEPGDCMYLVLDGEVRVSLSVEGRETMIAKLESGDFFGEIGLFEEGFRSADVISVRDTTLLRISKHTFQVLLEEYPQVCALFLRAVIRTVASRMRSIDEKYAVSLLLTPPWIR